MQCTCVVLCCLVLCCAGCGKDTALEIRVTALEKDLVALRKDKASSDGLIKILIEANPEVKAALTRELNRQKAAGRVFE